ncbi:MAG: hypothetical protein ABI560_04320 [Myxococcales bacterium]
MEQAKTIALILAMTLASGISDAQGFIHADRIWQDGRPRWDEVGKSALGFIVGIGIYWRSLKHMKQIGIPSPEIQTIVWFSVTIVGVALVSGKAVRWPIVDQAVALAVLAGVGWLMFRSA